MNQAEFTERYQELKYKGDRRSKGRYAEILHLFLQGSSDQEIADQLSYPNPSSIRDYMSKIVKHFEQSDRKELLELCYQYIPDQISEQAFVKNHISIPVTRNQNHYIQRPPLEENCKQEILKNKALIRIKGLKQTGKTLLLSEYIVNVAQQQGYKIALLNFAAVDSNILQDYNKFGKWFCKSIAKKFNIEDQLNNYWDDDFGVNSNCENYLEEYILQQIENPIVIALDNLEQILPYRENANDFSRSLRNWLDSHINISQQMKLVVTYSTDNYYTLDINSSPFKNLRGFVVELPEFNIHQAQLMLRNISLSLSHHQLEEIMNLLGGHPYLLNKAVNYLNSNPELTIKEFIKNAPTQTGIYKDDLLDLVVKIREDEAILDTVKKLLKTDNFVTIDPIIMFKLDNLGLIQKNNNQVQIRNQLYRQYFQANLN
jgi:hypothetical protein